MGQAVDCFLRPGGVGAHCWYAVGRARGDREPIGLTGRGGLVLLIVGDFRRQLAADRTAVLI